MINQRLIVTAVVFTGFVLQSTAKAAAIQDSYWVVIKSVSIQDTKANGDGWDIGGTAPDPRVIVSDGDNTKSTDTKQNKYLAKFNTVLKIPVESGDLIDVRVVDSDVLNDDKIGSKTLHLDDEMLKRGIIVGMGQVKALVIRFQKR